MPLVAKVTLGRDTRRIYFQGDEEASLSWSTLRKRIFERFKSNVADPSLFTVTYKDDEDDQVTLTSDAEMSELLNYHTTLKNGTKFLYLTIVPRKDNSTPVYVDYSSPQKTSLSDSQYLEKIHSSKNSIHSPYNKQTEPQINISEPSTSNLTPKLEETPTLTSYDSDCSLRATYASDDESVTSTPPDSPPSLRAVDPLRKSAQKILEKPLPQPQRTTFESTNQPPRPPFRHPIRPARAPFNPKRRPHTPRPPEEYTELKQLAVNLPQEEKTTQNQTSSETTVNQPKTKPEMRSIGCQTDSVLVIPRGSLENLSGELGQLLIKEIRSGGLLAPAQDRENFMGQSWGPIVGEAGSCDLSRSDIPPQASDGPQVAIPDGFSQPLASSQMIDDMSRSIADLSEEMRLLRQSLVMKDCDGRMQCPPSEGSCFSSTRSSTHSFGPTSETDPTPYRESDLTSSSNTDEGSPVTQKEGETSQYSSFDFYTSQSSETPLSEPDKDVVNEPTNDINELTNSSHSQSTESESNSDVNGSKKNEDVPVSGEIGESHSNPNEMFQSADDLSRFQKDLRNGLNSQFAKESPDIDDLLKQLSDMGFPNSVFNKVLLQQNHCNLPQTISDLKSFYSKSSGSI